MIILGIDPGIATVGWGVVEYKNARFSTLGYGAILTAAGLKVDDRLAQIYDKMTQIIKQFRPEEMAIEELFFNTNQKTAITVAEARGVMLLCARHHALGIYEYTPLQVKQSVVGYGRAEKNQVIAMVTSLLHLTAPPRPDDTADALAIAVCHAHTGTSRLKAFYNLK